MTNILIPLYCLVAGVSQVEMWVYAPREATYTLVMNVIFLCVCRHFEDKLDEPVEA